MPDARTRQVLVLLLSSGQFKVLVSTSLISNVYLCPAIERMFNAGVFFTLVQCDLWKHSSFHEVSA